MAGNVMCYYMWSVLIMGGNCLYLYVYCETMYIDMITASAYSTLCSFFQFVSCILGNIIETLSLLLEDFRLSLQFFQCSSSSTHYIPFSMKTRRKFEWMTELKAESKIQRKCIDVCVHEQREQGSMLTLIFFIFLSPFLYPFASSLNRTLLKR